MELNTGTRSATRQSWSREDSVKELFIALREQHPSAKLSDITDMLQEQLAADPNWQRAAADYIANNMWKLLCRPAEAPRTPSPQAKAARQAEVEEMAEKIKNQILLLNLEMPNGQRMRHCTGAQMLKFGGAYTKIGKRVGKNKRVGEVLSEEQLKTIMGVRA